MDDLDRDARIIRAYLIEQCQRSCGRYDDALITYGDLGRTVLNDHPDWTYPQMKPPFRGLGDALGAISQYEWLHGRPLLSAIVVRTGTMLPGPGFAPFAIRLGAKVGQDVAAWARTEQERVVDFWCDSDPSRLIDAVATRLLSELMRLRRELRQD